eukprot:2313909-Rhodomonas_salina.1
MPGTDITHILRTPGTDIVHTLRIPGPSVPYVLRMPGSNIAYAPMRVVQLMLGNSHAPIKIDFVPTTWTWTEVPNPRP